LGKEKKTSHANTDSNVTQKGGGRAKTKTLSRYIGHLKNAVSVVVGGSRVTMGVPKKKHQRKKGCVAKGSRRRKRTHGLQKRTGWQEADKRDSKGGGKKTKSSAKTTRTKGRTQNFPGPQWTPKRTGKLVGEEKLKKGRWLGGKTKTLQTWGVSSQKKRSRRQNMKKVLGGSENGKTPVYQKRKFG